MAKQDIAVELFYGGAWNTVSAYTRTPLAITRGRSGVSQQTGPSSATAVLDNRDGSKNPRNPASPLYGLIGRNTPMRVRLADADASLSVRSAGEVASWKPGWTLGFDPDAERGDSWTEAESAGILRRLDQGDPPARSAIRRAVLASDPVAYWPLEDGVDAATAGSGLRGGTPLRIASGTINFEPGGPVGSDGFVAVVEDNESVISGPVSAIDTGQWQLAFWVTGRGAEPGVNYDQIEIVAVRTTSDSASRWQVTVTDNGGGGTVAGIVGVEDSSGASVGFIQFHTAGEPGLLDGEWHLLQVTVDQDGADVDYSLYVDGVLGATGTLTSATAGRPAGIEFPAEPSQSETVDVGIAHLALWDTATLVDLYEAGTGHLGETAGRRIERLCVQEGIPFVSVGDLDDTQPMGAQPTGTVTAVLFEAERTDDGMLFDTRSAVGLTYRTGRSLYNRTPALTLDYAAHDIASPLNPDLDDLHVHNDVTAVRSDGSSARAVRETGPLNVNLPADDPQGVGRYTTQVNVNPASDYDLPDHAGWHLHKGTIDETRYPQVTVDLDASPLLADLVAAVDIGDLIVLENIPDDPDSVHLTVLGYTEFLGSHRRTFTFDCVPASVHNIGELNHADLGLLGSDGSTTTSSFNAGGATSLSVTVAAGHPLWTTGTVNFDITVAGVRLHVTNISGAASPQTFTVTQTPVNGVTKTIPAGSQVDLFQRAFVGR